MDESKAKGSCTPVKSNIINRFHQIFLLSGCWLSVKKKKNQIGQRSVWHFVLLSVFMNGLSLLHTSMLCASSQTNDLQFYADDFIVLFHTMIISGFYGHASMGNLSFPLFPWNGEHGE